MIPFGGRPERPAEEKLQDEPVPKHLVDAAEWTGRSESARGKALRGLLRTASRVVRSRPRLRTQPAAGARATGSPASTGPTDPGPRGSSGIRISEVSGRRQQGLEWPFRYLPKRASRRSSSSLLRISAPALSRPHRDTSWICGQGSSSMARKASSHARQYWEPDPDQACISRKAASAISFGSLPFSSATFARDRKSVV